MKTYIDEKCLPVYEALASSVRLKIINLLSKESLNIKQIANALSLSSAIITMHVKKLEKAGIVKSRREKKDNAIQKLCDLSIDSIEITFPEKDTMERKFYEIVVPVGHYTDFDVVSTCGIATKDKVIGNFDDSRYFLDPKRVEASILWFAEGFVEYKIPNYLLSNQSIWEIEVSFEISSEAPNVNEDYPSDISFYINGKNLGYWTSPGDFGGKRGKFTPKWWNLYINQYGVYKVLKVNTQGAFIDGQRISDITIDDIGFANKYFTFRIGIDENAKHIGGITLFGKDFGNYNQDIIIKMFYI